MKYLNYLLTCFFILFLTGCNESKIKNDQELVQVQIVDQNNQTQTVSSEDLLQRYKSTDFLNPQPYKKVIRFFSRDSEGHVPQQITSYYPNGQIKQYLEAIDLNAKGTYKEWHENGSLKITANIVGGKADFSATSQSEWLFDGISTVYDDKENVIAKIKYQKGKLEGESRYYYSDSTLKSSIPYTNDQIHGYLLEYHPGGILKKKSRYQFDELDGVQLIYWENETPLAIENYTASKLENGIYYNLDGKVISEINDGNGTKFIPIGNKEYMLSKYVNKRQQGPVHICNSDGSLKGVFHTKNNKKHGREIAYFQDKTILKNNSGPVMKYCIDWVEDKIHGNIKTWYSNGVMESQKQFANNKKNGPSIYWYKDGSIMSVEEYENDKLVNGKYFKKNNNDFISEVKDGSGTATIYDEEGVLIEKITYQNSNPIVS